MFTSAIALAAVLSSPILLPGKTEASLKIG